MSCCSVCDAKFTSMKRKEITCVFCKYACCRDCLQNYLMSGENKNKCMNCAHPFSDEYIEGNTSKVFMKKYVQKMFEDHTLRKEKELLPVTTELVGYIKEGIYELAEQATIRLNMIENDGDNDKKHFINCSIVGCKGYVNEESGWACTICKTLTCNMCLCKKDTNTEHICDETIISSINLIKSTSKECPTCKMSINRVSGCSQMFCTNCRTVFDWNTGMIDTGIIHNPHFYERQRVNRDVGEDRCFYTLEYWNVQIRFVSQLVGQNNILKYIVSSYFTLIRDMNKYSSLRRTERNQLNDFQQLRVRYLMNEIDEESWKTALFKLANKEKEYTLVRNIYNTLCETILAHMVNFIRPFHTNMNSSTPSIEKAISICESLERNYMEAISYANSNMPKIYHIRVIL